MPVKKNMYFYGLILKSHYKTENRKLRDRPICNPVQMQMPHFI